MFFEFVDSVINANAVGEIKMMHIDGCYKVMLFRLDGTYLTSASYATELEAERHISEILNKFEINNILM